MTFSCIIIAKIVNLPIETLKFIVYNSYCLRITGSSWRFRQKAVYEEDKITRLKRGGKKRKGRYLHNEIL